MVPESLSLRKGSRKPPRTDGGVGEAGGGVGRLVLINGGGRRKLEATMTAKSMMFLLPLMAATAAHAQLRDLNSTQDGRGTLNYTARRGTFDLSRVQVNLRNNGTAEIRLLNGVDEVVEGRWTNQNNRSVRIYIERIGRNAATGTGVVEHDGRGSITKVNLNGNVNRATFTLDFTAGDFGHDGGFTDLNSTRDGRGTIRYTSRNSSFDTRRAQVSLRRDGSAEVRIMSGHDETFFGRWTSQGGRTVRLTIDRMGRDRADGQGVIEHDGRGAFTRISLSGSANRQPFNLDFTAGAPGGNNDNPADRQFFDNAHAAIQDKFSRFTTIEWRHESLGNSSFGNRTLRGEFEIRDGRDRGVYRYTVIMGAGSAKVISATYNRR